MKVLIISPRAPQADGKGDAIRAAAFGRALAAAHEVEFFIPAVSMPRRLIAAAGDLLAGSPAQVGFCMPKREWTRATVAAARSDVVIAITVRAIRGKPTTPTIVDHVDCLSLNWAQRARGPEGAPRRMLARVEARRLKRWEDRVAKWATVQTALTEQEASLLPQPPPAHVLPPLAPAQPTPADRDIDVVFTGNMGYPPNRVSALWIEREIAPQIRRLVPSARVAVAGRHAARLRLRNVETMSDVPSISEILARSKVAIVPLTGLGTGVPNKALEAAACGAALVVTPWMHERLPLPACVASDAQGLAGHVARLLYDEEARTALAREAQAAVTSYSVEALSEQLASLLEAATASQLVA
jgi:hypothetical protein